MSDEMRYEMRKERKEDVEKTQADEERVEATPLYVPREDGVTHINVYSKGATELGRLLTNFAHTPFRCADGNFESVEGYYYWLLAEGSERRDELRTVWGGEAKKLGKELRTAGAEVSQGVEFRRTVARGIRAKLNANAKLRKMLRDSTLPLVHYYVYGGLDGRVVVPENNEWLLEALEHFRRQLTSGPQRAYPKP